MTINLNELNKKLTDKIMTLRAEKVELAISDKKPKKKTAKMLELNNRLAELVRMRSSIQYYDRQQQAEIERNNQDTF